MEPFEKALDFCIKSGIGSLIDQKGRIAIAFSGGADSSALLSFFCMLKEKNPSVHIICAHMNHMIRGSESDRDEAFCKKVCADKGIALEVCKRDIPEIAKEKGMGIEECARAERYAFFEELSRREDCLVATAHNADDNLETVIFNLVRGSGVKGLTGIDPIRENRYIRPFLALGSEEIRSLCRRDNIPFVTDSTNADTSYTRNSIRHTVVPKLYEINPKAAQAALRLSRSAREDCDYLESEAERLVSSDSFPVKRARELHGAILSRVILILYRKKANKNASLSEKNILDCKKIIYSAEGGRISLPHGIFMCVDRDIIYMEKDSRESKEAPSVSEAVEINGRDEPVLFHQSLICISENGNYIKDNVQNVYNLSLHAQVDCDRIYGKVFLRGRRPGDTFEFRGMNRKLKKLLCDKGISRRERDALPIIEDEKGILAVPYFGARDSALPTANSKNILHIYVYNTKNTEKE